MPAAEVNFDDSVARRVRCGRATTSSIYLGALSPVAAAAATHAVVDTDNRSDLLAMNAGLYVCSRCLRVARLGVGLASGPAWQLGSAVGRQPGGRRPPPVKSTCGTHLNSIDFRPISVR